EEMGMTPVAFSAIFAINSVMLVVGSQINRIALRRAGLRQMYAIGLSCSASAALVVLVTVLAGGPAFLVLGVLALMLCCFGMNQPNGAALTLTRHGSRAGTASALFGTCNFVLGPLVAPLVSLGGASSTTMALTMACASTGAALLAWLVVIPMLKADEQTGTGPVVPESSASSTQFPVSRVRALRAPSVPRVLRGGRQRVVICRPSRPRAGSVLGRPGFRCPQWVLFRLCRFSRSCPHH